MDQRNPKPAAVKCLKANLWNGKAVRWKISKLAAPLLFQGNVEFGISYGLRDINLFDLEMLQHLPWLKKCVCSNVSRLKPYIFFKECYA